MTTADRLVAWFIRAVIALGEALSPITPAVADRPDPAPELIGPPPRHPERLAHDVPLSPIELQMLAQIEAM